MRAKDVIELYRQLEAIDVAIWIDGGWAVDAVLGRQTRPHNDLDIAIEARDLPALREFLERQGYRDLPTEDSSSWNFVLADVSGRKIDVHVVVLDEDRGVWGEPRDGIAYPAGSLTGQGLIDDTPVRCVRADVLFQFKTSYPPRAIDRQDVQALAALLGRQTPGTHG